VFSSPRASTIGKRLLLQWLWFLFPFLIGCAGSATVTDVASDLSEVSITTASSDEEPKRTEPEGEQLGVINEPEPILPAIVTDLTGTEVIVNSVDWIIPLDGTVAEVVFALGLGDRVVAMNDGKIANQGAPEEVVNSQMMQEVFGLAAVVISDPVTGTPLCVPDVVDKGAGREA